MTLDCLRNIVGLDSEACECFAPVAAFGEGVVTRTFPAAVSGTQFVSNGVSGDPKTFWLYQNGRKLNEDIEEYTFSAGSFTVNMDTHFEGANYEVLALDDSTIENIDRRVFDTPVSPFLEYPQLVQLGIDSSRLWVFQNGQRITQESGAYTFNNAGITIAQSVFDLEDVYEVFVFFLQVPVQEYTASVSGLFLTDVEYGYPIRKSVTAVADCSSNDFWAILYQQREDALRDVAMDVKSGLASMRVRMDTTIEAQIGKKENKRLTTRQSGASGVIIKPCGWLQKDKFLRIFAIQTLFQHIGTIDIFVSSNDPDFQPYSIQANVQATNGLPVTLSEPILLPMERSCDDYEYYIYTKLDGLTYYDNESFCCGKPRWTANVDVKGFVSDEDLTNMRRGRGHMHGLILHTIGYCDETAWLCRLEKLGNENALNTIARMICLKAAIRLMIRDDKSDVVNQYTVLNQETRGRRINSYYELYEENLKMLIEDLPVNATGCWAHLKKNPFILKK